MTRRFYLCAPYRRREEMIAHAGDLEALGFEVSSRWVRGHRKELQADLVLAPELEAIRHEIIGENLGDLGASDALIHFSDAPPPAKMVRQEGPFPFAILARRFGDQMSDTGWNGMAEQYYAEIEALARHIDPRGTRHVETGIAIALELDLFVIGQPENIFHQAPFVSRYADWHEFIEAMRASSLEPPMLRDPTEAEIETHHWVDGPDTRVIRGATILSISVNPATGEQGIEYHETPPPFLVEPVEHGHVMMERERWRQLEAVYAQAKAEIATRGAFSLPPALRHLLEEVGEDEERCRVCGCTDDMACPGGCSWVAMDLCSRCVQPKPAP